VRPPHFSFSRSRHPSHAERCRGNRFTRALPGWLPSSALEHEEPLGSAPIELPAGPARLANHAEAEAAHVRNLALSPAKPRKVSRGFVARDEHSLGLRRRPEEPASRVAYPAGVVLPMILRSAEDAGAPAGMRLTAELRIPVSFASPLSIARVHAHFR
jgi:hypothetical protein